MTNARFFGHPDEVPHRAITQGIGTIRRAGRLLLLAAGQSKAAALRAALEGPVSPAVPASALQLHPQVTVVADRARRLGPDPPGATGLKRPGGRPHRRHRFPAGLPADTERAERHWAEPSRWPPAAAPLSPMTGLRRRAGGRLVRRARCGR